MKNLSIIACILLAISSISAQTPAFPGAEGFGRYTIGGRGGDIYHVTTLEDNNAPGSLRYAVTRSGARTVVFDISGTIHLTKELKIQNDYITIAGQTAPGDGICIADYPFTIAANEVILRYMRFRMGDNYAVEADALGGMDRKNIIIDHCSISWSTDECGSVYGNENMTMQWCIISESLRISVHEKGTHGYGGNWGGNHASYHHNLMAHHDSRTPRLAPRPGTQLNEWMDFRNNVIYNWGANNGCYGAEAMKINIINNYYKPGPATDLAKTNVRYRIAKIGIRTTDYVTRYPAFEPAHHLWGKFYVAGNIMADNSDVTSDNWTKGIYEQISNSDCDNLFTDATRDTIRLYIPLEAGYIHTHTAQQAYEKVLDYAGCSLSRDEIDIRIIDDTRNKKATYGNSDGYPGLINTPEDLRPDNAPDDWTPWPTLQSATAPADSDNDGMPDDWETANGLDPHDATDRNNTDPEGYTALERYINSLVQHITDAQYQDASLEYIPEISLETAVAIAKDGDTIEIAADQDVNTTITIDKNITIKARENLSHRPVLNKVQFIMGEGGSLTLDGITACYDETGTTPTQVTFITASNIVNFSRLEIRNCEIYGYGESFIQSNNKARYATIDELTVDNCLLHDFCKARANEPVFGLKFGRISHTSISNTTVYNCAGGVFVNEDPTDITPCPLTFEMRNVSIFDCGNAAGSDPNSKDIIDLLNKKAAVTASIDNSIIAGHPDKKVKFPDTSAYIRNSLIINEVVGELIEDTRIEGNIIDKNYTDFSLTTSPESIDNIGDPRWSINGRGMQKASTLTTFHTIVTGNTLSITNLNGLFSKITIYDLQGRCITERNNIKTDEISLPIPARGTYLIRLTGSKETVTRKIRI